MMPNRLRTRCAPAFVAIAALALAACTEKAVRPESGVIDVTPKANGHYVVDGEVLSFAELEKRIADQPPTGADSLIGLS